MTAFTESHVEEAALTWLKALGYIILHGPDIAVGEPGAECSDPSVGPILDAARLLSRISKTGRYEYWNAKNWLLRCFFAFSLEHDPPASSPPCVTTSSPSSSPVRTSSDIKDGD